MRKTLPYPKSFGYSTLLLALLCLGFFPQKAAAQFALNCPPNTVVSTDSASCDATTSYNAPFISGGPVTDTTYVAIGSTQVFVVPIGIGQVTIEAFGAQGNTNSDNSGAIAGGLGGYASGSLAVTPGETLYVEVGGGGVQATTGGYNGGGSSGIVGCNLSYGGGGGGASDVRQGGTALANRVIVAGGGGGAGGNRNQSCGRGTGGGGGGGYYGGGGGAAWPSTSNTLPTGGTQTAAGTGGTSAYTGAANNNGSAGALGIGGNGGDEVSSNQGGSGAALPGGAGGGMTGGIGQYSVNWTGQSGAGGSGYTGGVTNDSMATGVHTGAGQVRISFSVAFTLTQTAGLASGSTFPIGTTTNAFTVVQGTNSDSCSFTLTVVDSVAPDVVGCPGTDTLYADANCGGALLDYSTALTIADNCDPNPTTVQSPLAGTTVSGAGSLTSVTLTVSDSSGNVGTCTFDVEVVDSTAPIVTSCPPAVIFTPSTLDCNPAVNFTPPVFTENCAASITSTSSPGDNFPIGTTVITYTATDSSGNSSVCSFTLTVTSPVLDNLVQQTPGAICDGDTFSLAAPGGFTNYSWSTGATTASISANMTGIYWVDVTDSSGCIGRDSFLVAANQPMPTVTPTGAALCAQSGFASYQWYQNGTLIPGATNDCFTPTTDGTFQVIVFDSVGCQGISDTLFFVGVREALNNPGFEIFPNPAESQLNVRMIQPLNEAGTLMLYDLTGRIVLRHDFDQLSGTVTLDLGRVSAGSYIVEVRGDNFLGRRRLLRME
ncbi:MAG: HYR domain-containing protein [Bacteroidota bacterium]